jgi:hypothetical protein
VVVETDPDKGNFIIATERFALRRPSARRLDR